MKGRLSHSDLEVIKGGDIEVVARPEQSYGQPKVYQAAGAYHTAPCYGDGRYYTEWGKADEAPSVYGQARSQQPWDYHPVHGPQRYPSSRSARSYESHPSQGGGSMRGFMYGHDGVKARPAKLLGMPRNVVLGVLLGLGVVLVGCLTTFIGLFVAQRNAAAAANADASSGMMPGQKYSYLTAINWTSSDAAEHTAVFHQDASGDLLVHLREGSGPWSGRNITSSVMATAHIARLDVMPSTPLAAATNGSIVKLYYLTGDGHLSELSTMDPYRGPWTINQLGGNPHAASSSRLAAMWQVCNQCSNSLLVLFQDSADTVQISNWTADAWAMPVAIGRVSNTGTGLGIIPFSEPGRQFTTPSAVRNYRLVSGQVVEMIHGPASRYRWSSGNGGLSLSANATTSPPPEIASLSYGENGRWDRNVVTYLTNTGKLLSHVWNRGSWTIRPPSLVGGPPAEKLVGIAYTQALRMYGLAQGVIHEWDLHALDDPYTWYYVGQVADVNMV